MRLLILILSGETVEHWIEIAPSNQLKGIAVSNGVIYIEYNDSLYRWKPGTSKWYDTKILDGKNYLEITDAEGLVFFPSSQFASDR